MPAIITERTWRVQLFNDLDANPTIEYLRQQVKTYDDGAYTVPLPSTVRTIDPTLAATPLSGGPVNVTTYGQLLALIHAVGDAFAAEDAP